MGVTRKQIDIPAMRNRPLIGVIVDTSYKYGSSIVRGALRYANIKRRWLIYKQLGLPSNPPAGKQQEQSTPEPEKTGKSKSGRDIVYRNGKAYYR